MCWSGRGLHRNRFMPANPHLLRHVLQWPRSIKQLFVVVIDAGMCILAMWLAFSLRLDTLHWPEGLQWLPYVIAPILAFPILVNQGLYRAIFRYNGITALLTTGKAVAIYGAVLAAILFSAQWEGVPRSVGILQPLIFLLLVGASRSLGWLWLAGQPLKAPHRLLIYGAGTAGAQTAAGLVSARNYVLEAFADDDRAKVGRSINGVQVYAPTAVAEVVMRFGITDVLLALPSVPRQRRHKIIESLRSLPVRIRTIPGLTDLASGRVTVTDFQDLDLEDLLGRDPVLPDPELLGRHIRNQAVMVTGAGGSIGSELCRQIARQGAARLLLVDHSEFALYSIHQELQSVIQQEAISCELVPLLASVSHLQHMLDLCQAHRPRTIYHAAAYKHVPMVEANAGEGIRNNVFGTLNMVRAAMASSVENFVLVSTDKAVRPTNVMGASKRVAELILQAVASCTLQSPTEGGAPRRHFSMVRFGNVLGSSGSVIPLFRSQIAAGGPVTVTHPEVTRYFMTIPEAAQLVLQAGAMAHGGEVFVLDMGDPIPILDLAQRMIALSGLSVRSPEHPEGDIEIVFTGLRPGEKLYEELLIGDGAQPTPHPRILRAHEEHLAWDVLQGRLQALEEAIHQGDSGTLMALLHELVPGFHQEPQQALS